MKTFARAGLATLVALALSLAASAAYAIEYDDVIELSQKGVSDRAIVKLIVEDGRAFDMNEDEIGSLRDEDVSEIVIQAMLDPAHGQDWLDGVDTRSDDNGDSYDNNGSGGYSTSLDRAYGQGYEDGRSTALVYSFGYYYGPLARYYYDDPFYYPFWYSGLYASSYWPSYCAFYYRPSYDWCSPYPYNFYNYDSYYCYTWYDPGYYANRGYTVAPGYGRTVWDNGPRWRDGGLPPADGGNSRAGAQARFADRAAGRPAAPPILRQVATRTGEPRRDLVAGARMRDGRFTRDISPAPRGAITRSSEPVRRPVSDRLGDRMGSGSMRRGDEAGRMVREGRAPGMMPSRGTIGRSERRVIDRPSTDWRAPDRSPVREQRPSIDRMYRRGDGGGRGYDAPRRYERSSDSRQQAPGRQLFQRPQRQDVRQEQPTRQPERQPEQQRAPDARSQRQPEAQPQPEARSGRGIDRIPGRR